MTDTDEGRRKRSEAARKAAAARSPEARSEAARKAAATRTPEQRRQAGLKAAANSNTAAPAETPAEDVQAVEATEGQEG